MTSASEGSKLPNQMFDSILVLDFGSQYSRQIVTCLRKLNIYAELLACTLQISQLGWKPNGIVLSGGPYSVYEEDAPHVGFAFHFEVLISIRFLCNLAVPDSLLGGPSCLRTRSANPRDLLRLTRGKIRKEFH